MLSPRTSDCRRSAEQVACRLGVPHGSPFPLVAEAPFCSPATRPGSLAQTAHYALGSPCATRALVPVREGTRRGPATVLTAPLAPGRSTKVEVHEVRSEKVLADPSYTLTRPFICWRSVTLPLGDPSG